MSEDTKSSAAIERDVEASRARLEGTLGDLRERTSPGQIVDEIFAYAKRSGGGELTRNLGRSMRENPLPLLLVGAGIGWMMLDSGGNARDRREWQSRAGDYDDRGRGPGRPNDYPGQPPAGSGGGTSSAGAGGPGLGARIADGVAQVGDAVGNAASAAYQGAAQVGDVVGHAASAAYHGAADALHGVTGAAEEAGDYAGRAAGRAADFAGNVGGRVGHATSGIAAGARQEADHVGRLTRDGWRYLVEEQPLVLAAIGVALGAAVGAMIPSTGIENRAMGETAEEIKRTVGDVASRQLDQAQALVEDAVEGVSGELDKHDLAETATGAIGAVADRLKDAVAPEDTPTADAADQRPA